MATFVGIDAGGTSWKVLIGAAPGHVRARYEFPFAPPDQLIPAIAGWIMNESEAIGRIDGIGISCFGPIDRDRHSKDYGKLLETRKVGWSGTNVRTEFEYRTGISCHIDTDVNGALIAEKLWGAAKRFNDVVYITIGTGIGGAALVGGNLVGAPFHSEFGHVQLKTHAGDDYAGICEFHTGCIAGLASGSAIHAKWGTDPKDLEDEHPAWEFASDLYGRLATTVTYLMCPERIIFGGGVMQRPLLIHRVRRHFAEQANGYGLRPEARRSNSYLVKPKLGQLAGAYGGIAIAQNKHSTL